MPVGATGNFDESTAITIINNTFSENKNLSFNSNPVYARCTFNPLDKVVELYKRLLASEREKIEILQRVSERPS